MRSRQASLAFTSPVRRSDSIIKHSKQYWGYYKKSKNTDDPKWNIFWSSCAMAAGPTASPLSAVPRNSAHRNFSSWTSVAITNLATDQVLKFTVKSYHNSQTYFTTFLLFAKDLDCGRGGVSSEMWGFVIWAFTLSGRVRQYSPPELLQPVLLCCLFAFIPCQPFLIQMKPPRQPVELQ